MTKMTNKFVKIQEDRFVKSSIKRYKPVKDNILSIYFNTSRYKVEVMNYTFSTKTKRDKLLKLLDSVYGLDKV